MVYGYGGCDTKAKDLEGCCHFFNCVWMVDACGAL